MTTSPKSAADLARAVLRAQRDRAPVYCEDCEFLARAVIAASDARTAEQERADVVAWLRRVNDGKGLLAVYIVDVVACIERGEHVGASKK